jgi:hypothetical protein
MKLFLVAAALLGYETNAFSLSRPAAQRARTTRSLSVAEDLGLPCEDECALESFPNLPPSVHPGVLSGQAMMDLLNHAKENGEYHLMGPSFESMSKLARNCSR